MVKLLTTKRCEKADKRQESVERREKSENDKRENESPVHDAYHKGTKICKYCGGKHRIGPLQDPVTLYRINFTGTQITQRDFQNKGKSGWTGR